MLQMEVAAGIIPLCQIMMLSQLLIHRVHGVREYSIYRHHQPIVQYVCILMLTMNILQSCQT